MGDLPPGFAATVSLGVETLEVGVGFFGLALPKESVSTYYGAWVGYVDRGTDRTGTAGSDSDQ